MSRLKELRLHGFKSFADPTRFVFEPGVNAVIGPNGSGKSNMADAVRWVLGEQSNRSLRTRRADDVIFGGSDQRRPQGMAEAVLTLDNADGWLPIDFAEVSIGRRAYRSGESEYLINGARARLRDVVELLGEGRLGANELVVVGQGTVDAALSLRPEERRQLFEEAAGVKGLQVRRNEATVRLARSRDNLTRVSDLIAELKPQVRRLALQAEHQQQHDTLGARARALVQVSHRRREQAARAALGDARRRAAAAEAALEAHRRERETSRAAIAEAEARYWEAEEASRTAAAARQEARETLIRVEGRLEAVVARESELAALAESDERELAELESLAGEADDVGTEDIDPAIAAATAAEREWEAAVGALAAADDELLAAEQALADLRATQSDRIAAQARADEDAARHEARLAQAHGEREAADAALAGARRAAGDAAAAHAAAIRRAGMALAELEDRGRNRDAAQEAADATRHASVALGERLQATRAELDALAEPHDAGVRLGRRLADAGWQSLLDVIDAPEAAWPAIEAVVGGELEATLLWTDHDPSAAIDGARGAARLLAPANGANGTADGDRRAAFAAVRAERTLAEWVGMTTSVPTAFARTAVAADLSALLAGWRRLPDGWAAVTAQGDLADGRGVVLRGRGDPPGGASARAHARRRELTAAVGDLEVQFGSAQRAAHQAAETLRSARAAHLAARDAHDAMERAARVAREAREAADAAVERQSERAERAAREARSIQAALPASETPAADPAADRLARLHERAEEARSRRDALVRRRDEARAAWTATRREAEALQSRVAGVRSERAGRDARLSQLRAALPERRAAVETVREERAALDASLASARSAVDQAESAFRASEAARAERRAELQALEREQDGGGSRLAELERAAQAAAIEASRRDDALASLLRERDMALESLPAIEGAPDTTPTADIEALDDDALEAEQRRVRRTLAQIGSVNPFAVEEHRELAARLEEMMAQDSDLGAAIAATEELIASLDTEITSRFDAAFKAIGERFDEFCRLLFAGGSASLQMSDEADGDAPGGIEIVVRPPGKRLQRLAMLSGGERALTGVALLFAMLTVNPVPFCILDEVDAALDEANIGRFAAALRTLSESIDFVVVTHNRATIEVADTIYGVTMTDAAVSRVLSLRLSDVPAGVSA